MNHFGSNKAQRNRDPICKELMKMAERELAVFFAAVTKLFGRVECFRNLLYAKILNIVQLRGEFFNVLNHTNFQAPNFSTDGNNNSIFDPTGAPLQAPGVLGSTTTTSRQIQLGAKVVW